MILQTKIQTMLNPTKGQPHQAKEADCWDHGEHNRHIGRCQERSGIGWHGWPCGEVVQSVVHLVPVPVPVPVQAERCLTRSRPG